MHGLDLTPFKQLVHAHCGLRCEAEGEARLERAIAERTTALGCLPARYLARLAGDAAELQELVNLLTINETYFMREPEQIRLLVETLLPRMLAAAGGRRLRLLSAGCSTGEEPYSLAIALRARFGERWSERFELLAGDIDSVALARARRATYGEFSFRGCDELFKQSHFERTGREYRLRPCLRDAVQFHELNLVGGEPPAWLRDLDAVFFRNVSIYFDADTRRALLARLSVAMRPGAVLITGSAEIAANDLGVFGLREEGGLFYFSREPVPGQGMDAGRGGQAGGVGGGIGNPLHVAGSLPALWLAPVPQDARPAPSSPAPLPVSAAPPSLTPPVPEAVPQAVVEAASLDQARRLIEEHAFEQALPVLDALLAARPDHLAAMLLKAWLQLERSQIEAAQALAGRIVERDPWCVDALWLLGMCARRSEDAERALGCFRQAVYAGPACWPAHYQLAELYRQRGERELAVRSYRAVLQCLGGAGSDSGLQHLPLSLPAGEIRMLCQQRLVRLQAAASVRG